MEQDGAVSDRGMIERGRVVAGFTGAEAQGQVGQTRPPYIDLSHAPLRVLGEERPYRRLKCILELLVEGGGGIAIVVAGIRTRGV